MGYAQEVKSPNGTYFIARYTDGNGKRGVAVLDGRGKPARFPTKTKAVKAAKAADADVLAGRWKDPAKEAEEAAAAERAAEDADGPTLGEWANRWYASLRLAQNTMVSRKSHLELHILPEFEHVRLRKIYSVDIDAWEHKLREGGTFANGTVNEYRYDEDSIRTYRGTLHRLLQAAVPALIPANPAHREANTGLRTGRKGKQAQKEDEKVITDVLGGLLIAERLAILSGRDDEFVHAQALQHGLLRFGEAVGLERESVRPGVLSVEMQLVEVSGKLYRAIPKGGSSGVVVIPPFLEWLLDYQQRSWLPAECPCHGYAYVFRGMGKPRGAPKNGVTIRQVAAAAGVSMATVSNAVTHPERMKPETLKHVEEVIRDLGWVPGSAPAESAWHWRRSGFEALLTAAASGRLPPKAPQVRRAVPLAGPWPGKRLEGRNAQGRAEWCWPPVAEGLTPHGLRHSGRTWMSEMKIHYEMAEAQMRHELTGIEVYQHVTDAMREELRGRLQEAWLEALARRGEMSDTSPVPVVAELLEMASRGENPEVRTRIAQETVRPVLRARR